MPEAEDPTGIIRAGDVQYGDADGEALLLDLLQPDTPPSKPAPAVVWIHGGGWETGDKQAGYAQLLCPFLAKKGFVTASLNYRLSDQALFPAQLHDVKAAIRWLRANAADLGVDPKRIGVWGHSAGGHLSALLGTTGDLPELEGASGSPGYSSRVQAVVPVSPPTDFLAIPPVWTHEEPRRATSKLVGGPLEERPELVRLANPIAHIRPGVPPFLIVHGEADEIVPVEQAELLYDALKRTGAEATFLRLPRADHQLAAPDLGITNVDAWTDVAQRALGFFRTYLLG
jgi:acetyl esterase/lipase